jgi:xanthine dehydrogenase YagS FAD-binding subunit
MHAILGTSEHCIALHASDLCVSLVALDAVVYTQGPRGGRRIPLTAFYLTPGTTPDVENVLDHGELITEIEVPLLPKGARSTYLKVRDRFSYEFALTSAAVAVVIQDGVIRDPRVALGGVGTIPWRASAAEDILRGARPHAETFRAASEAALEGAATVSGTEFKVELGRRTLTRALVTVTGVSS